MERRDSTMLLGKNLKQKKKKGKNNDKSMTVITVSFPYHVFKSRQQPYIQRKCQRSLVLQKKKKRLKTESLHDEKATYEKRKMTKNKLRNNNRKGALTTFKKKNNNNNQGGGKGAFFFFYIRSTVFFANARTPTQQLLGE